MKNSWRHYLRRIAATCAVAGATAWSSAVCYAQVAADLATDPVYADGWQAGDNGGFGFEPWNFDGTYATAPPGQQRIDDGLKAGGLGSSEYNDIGRAWTLFNPVFEGNSRDIAQAGRGFAPLQVGQTLRTVIDNPAETLFFRGWTLRFVSGGESICYGGLGCTTGSPTVESRLNVGTFEYFTYGKWFSGSENPLFNVDTDQGVQIDFTLTGADSYELVMTPLDTSVAPYMESGTLAESGPIDWLEFEFYNTLHDPQFDTDFFIKSLEIIGTAPPGVSGDYNEDGTVNAADYTLWRDNLGASIALPNEDATPGMVTSEDYTVWQTNFGNTTGTGTGTGASGAVPEPSTFVSMIAAFVGLASLALTTRDSPKTMPAVSYLRTSMKR